MKVQFNPINLKVNPGNICWKISKLKHLNFNKYIPLFFALLKQFQELARDFHAIFPNPTPPFLQNKMHR